MNKENKYRLKRKSSLSAEEEQVGKAVVNAAFYVHKTLGPGLLERVYEICLCNVLAEKGFRVQRQMDIPIVFEELPLMKGFGWMSWSMIW